MLRLYTYGGGEGGGTVRVMYATQEHNLFAQRSHKLYISHHHKTKAWKPTKQKQKKTATATANAYKKLEIHLFSCQYLGTN